MTHVEPRDRALQALYEADQRGGSPLDAEEMTGKAGRLIEGVAEHLETIDAAIAAKSERWRPERMPIIDRAVLRIGVYELLFEPGTPAPVVMAEAARLASSFSTEKSAPFINGVLGAIAADR